MKCANPTCTHKAHQQRKKCFQCLVSNAKYMRYYRERRKCDPRFTADFLETLEGIAVDSEICDRLVSQWDKESLAGEPNILDNIGTSIPVSAPTAAPDSKPRTGIAL